MYTHKKNKPIQLFIVWMLEIPFSSLTHLQLDEWMDVLFFLINQFIQLAHRIDLVHNINSSTRLRLACSGCGVNSSLERKFVIKRKLLKCVHHTVLLYCKHVKKRCKMLF